MKILCWHKWKLISSAHFVATFYNGAKQDKTSLLYKCDKCQAYKIKNISGIWDMETLTKK